RLSDDLAAEDTLPTSLRAATPEQVVFQRLEVENVEKFLDDPGHGLLLPYFKRYLTRAVRQVKPQWQDAHTETRRMAPAARKRSETDRSGQVDVLVAGAGYVGLATAVALRSARPSLKVAVVDAAPAGVWQRDGRASAIAAAARRMLERLGAWAEIAPGAEPIVDMVVTDSRTADPVRP